MSAVVASDVTLSGFGWTDKHNPLRAKMESKMAGVGDINTAARVVRGSKRKAEEDA